MCSWFKGFYGTIYWILILFSIIVSVETFDQLEVSQELFGKDAKYLQGEQVPRTECYIDNAIFPDIKWRNSKFWFGFISFNNNSTSKDSLYEKQVIGIKNVILQTLMKIDS
jgi:hypothetical protein